MNIKMKKRPSHLKHAQSFVVVSTVALATAFLIVGTKCDRLQAVEHKSKSQLAISNNSHQKEQQQQQQLEVNAQSSMQNSDQLFSQQQAHLNENIGSNSSKSFSAQKSNNQQQMAPKQLHQQHNGRARKTNVVSERISAAAQLTSTTIDPYELLQDELRQLQEYRNTPPLFVTTTRDYFVDVARYPLGFKLATMQAIDSEGDRIEYRLEASLTRDASPYFSINSTSGELRLANKKFPSVPLSPSDETYLSGEKDDDDDDNDDADSQGDANQERVSATLTDGGDYLFKRPDYLYFLIVVADDGKYNSKVELQIHVFNSTAIGSRSPVQLTAEGSYAGIERLESILKSKTNKLLDKLYDITSASNIAPANRPVSLSATGDNSTLLYPNFVNPGLSQVQKELAEVAGTGGQQSSFITDSTKERGELVTNRHPAPYEVTTTTALPREELILAQAGVVASQPIGVASNMQQDQLQQQQQQQMVLSVAIIICSFLIITLVLLLFVVPLSVKRLRKRLKTVESSMQHDRLSQKNSNASSSIMCSSMSDSTTSHSPSTNHSHHLSDTMKSLAGSMCHSYQHATPTLSQFDLASTTSTRATESLRHGPPFGMLNHRFGHNQHQLVLRQSSLDQALSQPACVTGLPQTISHIQAQQWLPIGINRVNNGSILNPIYMQQQQQQQQHYHNDTNSIQAQIIRSQPFTMLPQSQRAQMLCSSNSNQADNRIYSLIDDESYSTVNTESTIVPGTMTSEDHQQQQVASLVGQTSDSRAYLDSQCAQQHVVRDSSSPASCDSRSPMGFLSLSARNLAQQHHINLAQIDNFGPEPDSDTDLEKRKQNLLSEFDSLWRCRPIEHERATKTIARTDRIERSEPQVRLKKRNGQVGEHEWEIDWFNRLKLLDPLGEGQFGQVWRAKLSSDLGAPQTKNDATKTNSTVNLSQRLERIVAVKALKRIDATNERERRELLDEIEIMKLVCQHPNVVKILHCCTRDLERPILLIMEFVELGNLQKFLEKSRLDHRFSTTTCQQYLGSLSNPAEQNQQQIYDQEQQNAIDTLNMSNEYCDFNVALEQRIENYHLTSRDLIKFIYHIAEGMKYISSKRIVHRDLASRNILISSSRVCKIGDFGMARHIESAGGIYERHSKSTKIPVRWMAPEVLLNNSFTFKSDVFSFGILMWEIVTLGSTPYPHLKTEQIIDAVARKDERPRKPDYCHSLVYNLMSECWLSEPDKRPTFSELVIRLDELLRSSNEYIELDQYPDHNYYNISARMVPDELV